MPYIKIKKDRCKGCMLCIEACPKKLIKKSTTMNKRGVIYVEFEGDCTGCTMCAITCPDVCIEVYK